MNNLVACASLVICICSIWGMCSKYYRDGFVGKIILFFMAISSFAVFTKSRSGLAVNGISETTLLCTLALYWIRHIWTVIAWHPVIKHYFKKHPHRDRRRNNDRRRN